MLQHFTIFIVHTSVFHRLEEITAARWTKWIRITYLINTSVKLTYSQVAYFLCVPLLPVFVAAVPQIRCQDMFCSAHEFCGEKSNGVEPYCLCRAIFASKYRSTSTFGELAMTEERYSDAYLRSFKFFGMGVVNPKTSCKGCIGLLVVCQVKPLS